MARLWLHQGHGGPLAVPWFSCPLHAGVQGELGCRVLGPQGDAVGLRASVFTQCHSALPGSSCAGPTLSPQHSELMLLPGVMHVSVSTRRRAPSPPPPHPLLARLLARAPALPLPNGPLCSCAGITPRVRGSHICAHTCSLQAGAPLGIPKFCLWMLGLPCMHGRGNSAPTCTPSRAARHQQAQAPAPQPLARPAPSGLRAHAAAYGSAAHQLLGRGRKKKTPQILPREGRGGGRERERERE